MGASKNRFPSHFIHIFFRVPNRARRKTGRVAAISSYPELKSVSIDFSIEKGWKGHRAGQFAFLKTDCWEEPHPFTIASAWRGDGKLSFLVKDLGDYSGKLATSLSVGDQVTIEGPCGRFDFEDTKGLQIWIGAGIGITPFIARLRELAHQEGQERRIVLFHPVSRVDEDAFDQLKRDAEDAGVDLRIWNGKAKGRLTGERIMEEVPDWVEGSVWFCGPVPFMKGIRKKFLRAGLREADFHRELFKMR